VPIRKARYPRSFKGSNVDRFWDGESIQPPLKQGPLRVAVSMLSSWAGGDGCCDPAWLDFVGPGGIPSPVSHTWGMRSWLSRKRCSNMPRGSPVVLTALVVPFELAYGSCSRHATRPQAASSQSRQLGHHQLDTALVSAAKGNRSLFVCIYRRHVSQQAPWRDPGV